MYGLRAANRYAKALLEYAIEQNALEVVFQDMSLINKTIKEHKDLERMLISPIVKTTALPLDEKLKGEMLQKVISLTKNPHMTLENKVDEHIIGGFILRVGDVQYNASLAYKLNKLRQDFQEKLFV